MKAALRIVLSSLLLLGLAAVAPATDLVITASSVAWVSGPAPIAVQAAETVTAGQAVFFDNTVNQYRLAKCNVAGKWPPTGVALSGASANGYFLLAKNGSTINIGATVVKNTVYFCSGNNAGGICPSTDITTGWETVFCIVATSTTNALVICQDTGIAN